MLYYAIPFLKCSCYDVYSLLNNLPSVLCILCFQNKLPTYLPTGAVASVMSLVDYRRYLKHVPLQSTGSSLTAYGGTSLPVVGSVTVDVTYGEQKVSLPLCVVDLEQYAPPLLGRLWLQHLRLDWPQLLQRGQVHCVAAPSLQDLRAEYQDVFAPGLGTVKGVTATLKVQDDAVPVYCRPRPVPFALRPGVE